MDFIVDDLVGWVVDGLVGCAVDWIVGCLDDFGCNEGGFVFNWLVGFLVVGANDGCLVLCLDVGCWLGPGNEGFAVD